MPVAFVAEDPGEGKGDRLGVGQVGEAFPCCCSLGADLIEFDPSGVLPVGGIL